MTGPINVDPVYAITLYQPWTLLIGLGVNKVETRSWAAPERLVRQVIALHAGKRVLWDRHLGSGL